MGGREMGRDVSEEGRERRRVCVCVCNFCRLFCGGDKKEEEEGKSWPNLWGETTTYLNIRQGITKVSQSFFLLLGVTFYYHGVKTKQKYCIIGKVTNNKKQYLLRVNTIAMEIHDSCRYW